MEVCQLFKGCDRFILYSLFREVSPSGEGVGPSSIRLAVLLIIISSLKEFHSGLLALGGGLFWLVAPASKAALARSRFCCKDDV